MVTKCPKNCFDLSGKAKRLYPASALIVSSGYYKQTDALHTPPQAWERKERLIISIFASHISDDISYLEYLIFEELMWGFCIIYHRFASPHNYKILNLLLIFAIFKVPFQQRVKSESPYMSKEGRRNAAFGLAYIGFPGLSFFSFPQAHVSDCELLKKGICFFSSRKSNLKGSPKWAKISKNPNNSHHGSVHLTFYCKNQ